MNTDFLTGVAIGHDDSVVLAGYTTGDWNAENAGGTDFVAVKLDADGNEVWTWQVRLFP